MYGISKVLFLKLTVSRKKPNKCILMVPIPEIPFILQFQ
jgi:hypothetical protein